MRMLTSAVLTLLCGFTHAVPMNDNTVNIHRSAGWMYGEDGRRDGILFMYGIQLRHGRYGERELANPAAWANQLIEIEKERNTLFEAEEILDMIGTEIEVNGVPRKPEPFCSTLHIT